MRIHAVTIDTAQPQKLAAWWSDALGVTIGNDYGNIVQLTESSGFPLFQFQKIENVPEQRNRLHVDFRTTALEQDAARLLASGATLVEKFELPQIRYMTLLDPDGNSFDLVEE